jgi:hypothetical protein
MLLSELGIVFEPTTGNILLSKINKNGQAVGRATDVTGPVQQAFFRRLLVSSTTKRIQESHDGLPDGAAAKIDHTTPDTFLIKYHDSDIMTFLRQIDRSISEDFNEAQIVISVTLNKAEGEQTVTPAENGAN